MTLTTAPHRQKQRGTRRRSRLTRGQGRAAGGTQDSGRSSMLFHRRFPHGTWRLNTLLATTQHPPWQRVAQQLGPRPWWSATLEVLLAFCRRFVPKPRLVVAVGSIPCRRKSGLSACEEQDWLIPVLSAGALPSRGGTHRPPATPTTLFGWVAAGRLAG